jgi:hypothetical protein
METPWHAAAHASIHMVDSTVLEPTGGYGTKSQHRSFVDSPGRRNLFSILNRRKSRNSLRVKHHRAMEILRRGDTSGLIDQSRRQ